MERWISVTTEEEFEGPVFVYENDGEKIAIFKLEDGYYAIQDRCSHEEASLAEGEIDDDQIECPLHGALFDIRTGKNLSLPAVLHVKSYPVKVDAGQILVKVDD
jgi:nitrite reductase/ring-hydroxylating ferredoxin subunit